MKYNITLQGRASGVERYSLSRKAAQYWESADRDSLTDYLFGEEVDIPEEVDFLDGAERYEVVLDETICLAEESVLIIVDDEHSKVVYGEELYDKEECEYKVNVDYVDDDIDILESEENTLYVYNHIKGTLFSGYVEIDGEFDIDQLKLTFYENSLGEYVLDNVWYAGEQVVNKDFSYMGKGTSYIFD
jgi:hypothetical protein